MVKKYIVRLSEEERGLLGYNGLEKLGAPIRRIRNWSDKGFRVLDRNFRANCAHVCKFFWVAGLARARRRIHGKETTGIYVALQSESRFGGNSGGGDFGRSASPFRVCSFVDDPGGFSLPHEACRLSRMRRQG